MYNSALELHLSMARISKMKLKIDKRKLFKFQNKLIIFGSQSESTSDFYDLAVALNLQPICIDNLDEPISKLKHQDVNYKMLKPFHLSLPTVISVITPKKRITAMLHAKNLGIKHFTTLINPNSDVCKSAVIGEGVFINSSTIIGSNAVLSNFVTINKGANIAHDVTINEYTHVAPSACILGSVKVGSLVTIGANATILPKVIIGDRAVVGAGAVVTRDVLPDQVVSGNPASVH